MLILIFPDLQDLVWKTCKLCSDNKRAVDEAKAKELVGDNKAQSSDSRHFGPVDISQVIGKVIY